MLRVRWILILEIEALDNARSKGDARYEEVLEWSGQNGVVVVLVINVRNLQQTEQQKQN